MSLMSCSILPLNVISERIASTISFELYSDYMYLTEYISRFQVWEAATFEAVPIGIVRYTDCYIVSLPVRSSVQPPTS